MLKRLVSTVLGVALVSCAVYAQETTTPVVVDLQSACKLATEMNPQYASALASASEAQASIQKAESATRPTLSANSDYGFVSKATTFGNTPILEKNTWANRLEAQYLLYSGGRVRADIDRAKSGYQAASQAASATRADVVTNAAGAYFVAKQAREGIDVAEKSVESTQANYDAAQKLHNEGVVTKADVLRAEVALTNARENLITAQNECNKALAGLKTAIGLSQETPVELGSQDTITESALAMELAKRPEVSAAEALVGAARAQKQAARAGNKPTVALVGDFFNLPVGAEFPRMSNTLGAGVRINFNILDGGLTRANVKEADAAISRTQQDLNRTQQVVDLQIKTARLDLDSAKAKLQATETQVQSAEESLRVLQTGYKEGINPLTDVLTAESALTSSRYSRLAAVYEKRVAEVNLLRAMGRTEILCSGGSE